MIKKPILHALNNSKPLKWSIITKDMRRHQLDTFPRYWPFVVESPPVTSGFPFQRSVTRSFGIVFDLRLNKWLSKQSRCRWFETPWRSLWRQKWITQFLYRNHELITNVRTFAQISMIGEFYGLCQSVIEFANWTQIINNNWNTSRVGLCKDASVHSLIHKHMRLYCGKLYAPNMTDRDNFSDKKLALLPNSFWKSPPFYYEMAFFPWCFMCKRTWTLVFGNFLRVHNA